MKLTLLGGYSTVKHYAEGTEVSIFFTVCIRLIYLFTIQDPKVLLTTQVNSCLLVQFLAPTSSGIFFLFILVHQMVLWKNPRFSFVLFSLFCFHAVFSPLEMTCMGNGLLQQQETEGKNNCITGKANIKAKCKLSSCEKIIFYVIFQRVEVQHQQIFWQHRKSKMQTTTIFKISFFFFFFPSVFLLKTSQDYGHAAPVATGALPFPPFL